jgi:hypothetical protein
VITSVKLIFCFLASADNWLYSSFTVTPALKPSIALLLFLTASQIICETANAISLILIHGINLIFFFL